jgi:hypothetical protein
MAANRPLRPLQEAGEEQRGGDKEVRYMSQRHTDIANEYNSGVTITSISSWLGISRQRVYQILQESGIKLRQRSPSYRVGNRRRQSKLGLPFGVSQVKLKNGRIRYKASTKPSAKYKTTYHGVYDSWAEAAAVAIYHKNLFLLSEQEKGVRRCT